MSAGNRLAVAYHEAGHAVAAWAFHWPFRYVTMSPRRPLVAGPEMFYRVAASVVWRPGRVPHGSTGLAVVAAGVAAEVIHNPGLNPFDLFETSGRHDLRKIVRDQPDAGLVDPTAGPEELAAQLRAIPSGLSLVGAFHLAYRTLTRHGVELAVVAWELAGRSRALHWGEFLELVGGHA